MAGNGSRTDQIVAGVREAAERLRALLDNERGLTGVVFSVRFGHRGEPVKVIARPEAQWRPNHAAARST